MAINPETAFPGKITPSSPDYPYGEARNVTVPGDGTGTPWKAQLLNDIFGFQQALLSGAGIVPSGNPDKVGTSQYLDALQTVVAPKVGTIAALKALDSSVFSEGDVITVTDANRGDDFIVRAGSLAEDGGNIFEFDDQAASPANTSFLQRAGSDNTANIQHFGAVVGQISSAAIQLAIDTGLPLYLPEGEYLTDQILTVTLTGDYKTFGTGKLKNIVSDEVLIITNPVAVTTTLNGASDGTNVIAVTDATGAQFGDMMVIESTKLWDDERPEYIAGEILTVEQVVGNNVTTVEIPEDVYLNTDSVKFYRPFSASIEDLSIEGDPTGVVVNGQKGIRLVNVFKPVLTNVNIDDASKTMIELQQCLSANLISCSTISDPLFPGFAYGLALSSSSKTTVTGGSFYGGRHGVTHGGTIPARDNRYYGVDILSNPIDDQASYDEHANTDRTRLYGCTITEGMGTSGRNAIYEGCKIKGTVSLYLAPDDYHPDEYRKFIDCDIENISLNLQTIRIRPLEERNQALHLGLLEFRGTKIHGRQTSLTVLYFPNDFVSTTCHIDLVKYDGVDIFSNGDTAASHVIEHNTPNPFTIDEVLITGGSRIESNTRMGRMSDEITRFRILNSTFVSRDILGMTFEMTGGELFEFNGSIVDMAGAGFQTTISVDRAKVLNSEFIGIVDRVWDFTGSAELQVNTITSPISQAITFDLNPGKYYHYITQENVIAYRNSAPTAGAWTRGDRVYLFSPAASGTEGFICVASGTPGTWKTFGAISA